MTKKPKKIKLSVYVNKELSEAIKQLAEVQFRSISGVGEIALALYVANCTEDIQDGHQ